MPQLHLDVAHNLRRRALRGETFLSLFLPFSFLTLPSLRCSEGVIETSPDADSTTV